jgi:putative FmdB family regulatory protein
MPRYEYRCRSCGATFEMQRPMRDAAATATCPVGHDDTVKLLSTVALTGRGAALGAVGRRPEGQSGAANRPAGGCCGGACGC